VMEVCSYAALISARRRRLPQGNGGDCPGRKTPHRAPPHEELDPPYDIKLFCAENYICS